MIASHCLIDNQSLHAMDTYISMEVATSVLVMGLLCCSSPTSTDPAHCCSTIHYALYTYTLPIFFVIMLLSSSSYYTLHLLSTASTVIVLSIHHLSVSFAIPTLFSLSSTTASIILLYLSFVMSLLLLLSYLIVYSTLFSPFLYPSLSLIFLLCQHKYLTLLY